MTNRITPAARGQRRQVCDAVHIPAGAAASSSLQFQRERSMFLVDALLILAMLFFLFLPISDRRTVRM
ncbi:hypothetical protein LMJ43_37570, partial [Streptomyces rochei]|nr:hypothetical protein [Streptomyces rochei]